MRRVLALFVLLMGTAAAEPRVTVSVEHKEVAVGTAFMVKVRAEGRAVGQFQMPDHVDGLEIDPAPSSTATNVLYRNGNVNTSLERGYLAEATRAGTVTIPPVTVEIDGQTVRSEPLQLTVTPEAAVRSVPGSQGARSPESRPLTQADLVFVTSEVDKKDVYEGQAIRLTLSLWKLDLDEVNIEGYRSDVEPPRTEGFYTIPRVPTAVSQDVEDRNGRRYRVERYRQMLYPMKSGTLQVGAWTWEGSARLLSAYGLEYKPLALEAPALEVVAKPLPQPPPPSFAGAVGKYQFRGEVPNQAVSQGVPFDLILRIVGEGNPDSIGEPAIPEIDGARVSVPKREVSPIRDPASLVAEKTFIYSILPTQPGRLTIPAVSFAYFDPELGQYRTENAGPFEIDVQRSQETAHRVTVDASNRAESATPREGLLPVVTNPGTLHPRSESGWSTSLLIGLPPLGYLALALVVTRKRRFDRDERYARSYRARSKGLRRLEHIADAREPAEELYRTITGFIADKFGVPESGITSADAARLLEANGVEDEVAKGFTRILRACERSRYGADPLSMDEIDALLHAAHAHMDSLDHKLKAARL